MGCGGGVVVCGGGGGRASALCEPAYPLCLWVVPLIMWQLGRLIVGQWWDYEGLCASERDVGGEGLLICQAERKLAGAAWS